ncbi:MAG: putative transcriptional regulator of viral defense system [Acidimicrobiales bacterium]
MITPDDLPQVFTHAEALARGLSDRALYKMRDSGVIDRLARGIYAQLDLEADPDLVEIAVRAPNAILCLTTALAHHELTDDIPQSINAALPRQQRSPKTAAPVTWHRFEDATFDLGRDDLALTDQLRIGIYSSTRSVLDAYRLRHLYGIDQAHEALKRWLRLDGNQPTALLTMARHFPSAEPTVRTTLETLL